MLWARYICMTRLEFFSCVISFPRRLSICCFILSPTSYSIPLSSVSLCMCMNYHHFSLWFFWTTNLLPHVGGCYGLFCIFPILLFLTISPFLFTPASLRYSPMVYTPRISSGCFPANFLISLISIFYLFMTLCWLPTYSPT